MKIAAALGLAVLTSASLAQAQTAPQTAPQGGAAAGTLPNAFGDAPAARSVAAPRPAAPTRAGPASGAAPVSAPETVEAAKTALRAAILAMQAGTPDYDAMTPDLAAKIREQSARLIPLLQGFGEVQAGVHAGSQDGVETFGVAFEQATTEWRIALNPEGKIALLLFRPAPVEESAVEEPAEDETAPPAN